MPAYGIFLLVLSSIFFIVFIGFLSYKYVAPAWRNYAARQFIYNLTRSNTLHAKRWLSLGASFDPSEASFEAAMEDYFALPRVAPNRLNVHKFYSCTLITLAILQRNTEIIKELLDRGVVLQPSGSAFNAGEDLSPLSTYFSVPYEETRGDPVWAELYKQLLTKTEICTTIGMVSPVLLATKNGYPLEIIQELVDRGEEVNNSVMISRASRKPSRRTDICPGESALYWAVMRWKTDPEESKRLVNYFASLDAVYLNTDPSPLEAAACLDATALMHILFDAGVSLTPELETITVYKTSLPENYGSTASGNLPVDRILSSDLSHLIWKVVRMKAKNALKLLLEKGVDPYQKKYLIRSQHPPETPLFHSVVYEKDLDLLKTFIETCERLGKPINLDETSNELFSIWVKRPNGRFMMLSRDLQSEIKPLATALAYLESRVEITEAPEQMQNYQAMAAYLRSKGAKTIKVEGVFDDGPGPYTQGYPASSGFNFNGQRNNFKNEAVPSAKIERFLKQSNSRTPYEVLNCTNKASDDEIKAQYRRLALKFHPDKNFSTSSNEFTLITQARDILVDQKTRDEFDAYLKTRNFPTFKRH